MQRPSRATGTSSSAPLPSAVVADAASPAQRLVSAPSAHYTALIRQRRVSRSRRRFRRPSSPRINRRRQSLVRHIPRLYFFARPWRAAQKNQARFNRWIKLETPHRYACRHRRPTMPRPQRLHHHRQSDAMQWVLHCFGVSGQGLRQRSVVQNIRCRECGVDFGVFRHVASLTHVPVRKVPSDLSGNARRTE